MKIEDMAQLSTYQAQQKVHKEAEVTLLKKSLEESKIIVDFIQKSLQNQPKPPKNEEGSISLYA